MFGRSFRSRLTSFFIGIVILPMVAVSVILFRLVADSERGKSDARLSAGADGGLGACSSARSSAPRRPGARSAPRQQLADGDRRRRRRADRRRAGAAGRAGRRAARVVLELASGERYAVGDGARRSPPRRRQLVDAAGPAGRHAQGRDADGAGVRRRGARGHRARRGRRRARRPHDRVLAPRRRRRRPARAAARSEISAPPLPPDRVQRPRVRGRPPARQGPPAVRRARGAARITSGLPDRGGAAARLPRLRVRVRARGLALAAGADPAPARGGPAARQRRVLASRCRRRATTSSPSSAASSTRWRASSRSAWRSSRPSARALQHAIRRVGESFAKGLDRDALLRIVVQTAVDGVAAEAGRAARARRRRAGR